VVRVPPLEEEAARERLEILRETPKKRAKAEKEVDKEPEREYISFTDTPEAFTDDERDILLAIEKRSLTADDIAEAAQIPARRVLSALTMLQLRDMVEEKPGKRFYAKVILKP
jgi:DNA processing protein